MNLNDTSAENIAKLTTLWSKSINLITQRKKTSDSETLKNNREKAKALLANPDLWIFIWNNNSHPDIERKTLQTIASWDMDNLIVPFAQYILQTMEKDGHAHSFMRPIRMDVLFRSLLNGYKPPNSIKALEIFLRSDSECSNPHFVNERFAFLLQRYNFKMAVGLISKEISVDNQWTLMCSLFESDASWKNVIRDAKKMVKAGWNLNHLPTKNNIVGHILRTNRVFYASKEECQDLIKIGVRPTNLQVPCSSEFMEAFAQFEKSLISGQIKVGSKTKTTRTKKM